MGSDETTQLGWIGLGSMGLAMATNIQKYLQHNKLPALRYTNRTLSRGDSLKELGATPADSIREVVEKSDVVFITVSDDEALNMVVKEILSCGCIASKTFADTTTVHPDTTSTVSSQLAAAGAFFVATPVFGAPTVARAGQLLVAVAGPNTAVDRIAPYLKGVIARGVMHVGDDPAKALLLKTMGNFFTAGLIYLISEAHTLAEAAGLPAPVFETLLEENFGAFAHAVSKRLTSGAYYPAVGQRPGSGLELGMKDVGHGVSVAKERGVRLEVGELSMQAMQEAKKYGDEKGRALDSSAVFGVVRQKAGMSFETELVGKRDGELM